MPHGKPGEQENRAGFHCVLLKDPSGISPWVTIVCLSPIQVTVASCQMCAPICGSRCSSTRWRRLKLNSTPIYISEYDATFSLVKDTAVMCLPVQGTRLWSSFVETWTVSWFCITLSVKAQNMAAVSILGSSGSQSICASSNVATVTSVTCTYVTCAYSCSLFFNIIKTRI